MNLNDLQSYVRVVELGTIAAAAKHEGVPRSTITRRIARLEQALGVELIRRGARSFVVTDDGLLFHRLTTGAMREVADAVQALESKSDEPRGRLVIAAPDFARSEPFARLMVEYGTRFPDVEVQVRIDNRVVDLIHEGVDVAIRAHTRNIPGASDLMSRAYDLSPMRFYASSAYLARRPPPTTLDALPAHSLVLHAAGVGVPKQLVSLSGETATIDLGEPRYRANDTLMVRALLESDAGIGMLPTFVAAQSVARGTLAPVLSEWEMRTGRLALVWPASRHLAPRVRAFVELAHELFGRRSASSGSRSRTGSSGCWTRTTRESSKAERTQSAEPDDSRGAEEASAARSADGPRSGP